MIKKDKKASFFFYQGVDKDIFAKVSYTKFSKQAWEILHSYCQGVDIAKTNAFNH